MKWYGISGSWRTGDEKLRADVRSAVAEIISRGDGIVSGGALGVDQIATEEALRLNPEANQIKIIIPASLEIFATHFRKRAQEGVITGEQAEALVELLTALRAKGALQEMMYTELNEESYFARNTEVLNESDELLAFQVNKSSGTQDTIDKASLRGMPVTLKQYNIG